MTLLKNFDITKVFSKWFEKQSKISKTAFISVLIIGFVSHLFFYTGRYYGRTDNGMIVSKNPMVDTGRWFNDIMNIVQLNYVIPLVSGLLVTLFIALAAFFVCKLFDVEKKSSAILIAGLMSTFPSIANTNLFLHDSPNYHFAALLGVLAVYIAVKFKFGFLPGGMLVMLTLAIYQSYFNVILALSLTYLILVLIDNNVDMKSIFLYILKISSMVIIGGIAYLISLPISFKYYDTTFNDYMGMSPASMSSRFSSFSCIIIALKQTLTEVKDVFFSNMFTNTNVLKFT